MTTMEEDFAFAIVAAAVFLLPPRRGKTEMRVPNFAKHHRHFYCSQVEGEGKKANQSTQAVS
jgi:hypothetical protein